MSTKPTPEEPCRDYEMKEIEALDSNIHLEVLSGGERVGEVLFSRCAEVEWKGDKAHALRAIAARFEDTILPILEREKIGRLWAAVWSHRRGLHKFLERMRFECWNRQSVNVLIMEVKKWRPSQ